MVQGDIGDMRDWLERLGSAAPTPGGGAAAALAASAGAALVEMVVNLTLGKKAYAEHEEHVRPIGERARELRGRALELITEDEAAFESVMSAYGLPKSTDAEKAARSVAIVTATAGAAQPPMQVAEVAARVIELAAGLPGRSNRTVLSDVGVATSLALSALESSAINVEVNLAGLPDGPVRDRLRKELDMHLAAATLGQEIVANIRAGLAG